MEILQVEARRARLDPSVTPYTCIMIVMSAPSRARRSQPEEQAVALGLAVHGLSVAAAVVSRSWFRQPRAVASLAPRLAS